MNTHNERKAEHIIETVTRLNELESNVVEDVECRMNVDITNDADNEVIGTITVRKKASDTIPRVVTHSRALRHEQTLYELWTYINENCQMNGAI